MKKIALILTILLVVVGCNNKQNNNDLENNFDNVKTIVVKENLKNDLIISDPKKIESILDYIYSSEIIDNADINYIDYKYMLELKDKDSNIVDNIKVFLESSDSKKGFVSVEQNKKWHYIDVNKLLEIINES